MKNLLKVEFKKIFTLKNLILILLVLGILSYWDIYSQEKMYEEADERSLEQSNILYKAHEDVYNSMGETIEFYRKDLETADSLMTEEDIGNLEKERDLILTLALYYDRLAGYNIDRVKYYDDIKKTMYTITSLVYKDIYQAGINPFNKGLLYRNNIEDLHERLIRWKASIDMGEGYTGKADGSNTLHYSMNSQLGFSLAIGLIIILNFKVWSDEFSQGAIKNLLTQAYSRKSIYMSRIISRSIFSVIIMLIILFGPSFIARILNGPGLTRINIYDTRVFEDIFNLNYVGEQYQYLKAINSEKLAFYTGIIAIIYSIMLMSLVNMVSIISKDNIASIIGLSFLMPFLFINYRFNPLYYIRTYYMFRGMIGIGFGGAIIVMLATILLSNFIGYRALVKYEA